MDVVHDSFFLDALSDGAVQSPTWIPTDPSSTSDQDRNQANSRDKEPRSLAVVSFVEASTNTEPRDAAAVVTQAPEQPREEASVRALLIFALGERRLSNSCNLGVLNEHPQALKEITSNQCFSTSAFLGPALRVVMAELWPSMTIQVAVRLTTISMRLAAEILLVPRQDEGDSAEEERWLSASVQGHLHEAVPYYQWQGHRNYYGRVQYLMALLEEAIRVLGVSMEDLTVALEADGKADDVLRRTAQCILSFGESPADVCGVWAAETLLLAWLRIGESSKPLGSHSVHAHQGDPVMKEKQIVPSPEVESEDELPSPSDFIRTNGALEAFRKVSSTVKVGSRAENPVCIADSDANEDFCPPPNLSGTSQKTFRHSCRSEALQEINYNTNIHPQDPDLPTGRKRRREPRSDDSDAGARTSVTKRNKVGEGRLV